MKQYRVFNKLGELLSSNSWPETFGNIRVQLVFDERELLDDIANVAYTQGDVARVHDKYGHDILGEKGENYMHQWKDVCEDGNVDRVKRVIGIAISDVEQILYRFTKRLAGQSITMYNTPTNEKEYSIDMIVPSTFGDTTCSYLLQLINEYIVDSVLEDWANLTYPEAVAVWAAKKTETSMKISHVRSFTDAHHQVKPSII